MDILQRRVWRITLIGTNGTFEQACRNIALEVASTVIEKHKDYGPDNILIFKEEGLVVRMWDKIGRLKHLLWKKKQPTNEAIEDSFTDLAGYAIIGLMLQRECFTYKLEEDQYGKS